MIRRRLQLIRADREEGTTLIEIMAGLTVMGIFLALFAGTMFNIFRSTSAFESATINSSQTNNAFNRLDKLVRYASAISTPSTAATSAGNYYVEFQTSNTGTTICTQLQLNVNSKTLKSRTWTVPTNGGYQNLTGFSMLANGVATTGTPFVLSAGGSFEFEQLTVNLSSTTGNPAKTATTSVVFSALNSSASNDAAGRDANAPKTVCQETTRP